MGVASTCLRTNGSRRRRPIWLFEERRIVNTPTIPGNQPAASHCVGTLSLLLLLLSTSLASVEGWSFPLRIKSTRQFYQSGAIDEVISDPPELAPSVSTRSSQYDQLDALKESIDIVQVIESYELERFERRRGGSIALCPFHADTTPSLSVDGPRRMFQCFGCGVAGDVFSFAQKYSQLPGQTPMNYYQAVQHVTSQFGNPSSLSAIKPLRGSLTQDDLARQAHRRQRLLAANAAALSFFQSALIQTFAGPARRHLMDRGFRPSSVSAFALGYAPDAYFRREFPQTTTNHDEETWGQGSLVRHLLDLEFTPQEIVDAGLAMVIKKSLHEDKSMDRSSESGPTAHHDNIMDRFLGRLMIPIFDASGENVLGFGGRVLFENKSVGKFKEPKYVNTAESLVFQKKMILFGEHHARVSIQKARVARPESTPTLLIVEGYMDAMTLWRVDVGEVVASMGTAFSKEQLLAATKVVNRRGRIVLCLDNDAAGISTMERLCQNGVLNDVSKAYPTVEIRVASLPSTAKDPGDAVESLESVRSKKVPVSTRFRKSVVETAVDWFDWYLARLMQTYDAKAARGGPGSFSSVFRLVAEFLARSCDATERTKRSFEVAGVFAKFIAGETNSTASQAVCHQLQVDLIDTVSRIASTNDAILRRAEFDQVNAVQSPSLVLAALTSGAGPSGPDDVLPTGPVKAKLPSQRSRERQKKYEHRGRSIIDNAAPNLIPHFVGFDFASQSDKDWLGIREKQAKVKYDRGIGLLSRSGELIVAVHFALAPRSRARTTTSRSVEIV
jgi:DNA primase catalytic core